MGRRWVRSGTAGSSRMALVDIPPCHRIRSAVAEVVMGENSLPARPCKRGFWCIACFIVGTRPNLTRTGRRPGQEQGQLDNCGGWKGEWFQRRAASVSWDRHTVPRRHGLQEVRGPWHPGSFWELLGEDAREINWAIYCLAQLPTTSVCGGFARG